MPVISVASAQFCIITGTMLQDKLVKMMQFVAIKQDSMVSQPACPERGGTDEVAIDMTVIHLIKNVCRTRSWWRR